MADQNQRISDLLDTLTDADSTEIETALRIFEPNDVAAVVAERALAGGGGGGGSSAYGTSYLGSFGASSVSLTAGSLVATFDSPADLKVGTDIALNVDGKTFEIGTDGWYSVYVDVAFIGGGADTDSPVTLALDVSSLDAADILSAMNGMFQVQAHIVGLENIEYALSLPPFNFKAGDTFQVVVGGAPGMLTPATASCNIVVVRAA